MTNKTINNNGIGMGGALFLLFLGLKLSHNIDWSWWWIFAPIWMPLSFLIICLIIVGLTK